MSSGAHGHEIGRPVRIVSLSFGDRPLEAVLPAVEAEAARGADIIALPETYRGQNETTTEGLTGPSVTSFSRVAEEYQTYIVVPMDLVDGGVRTNTAVLIDRSGRIAGQYSKAYPFWAEYDLCPPVTPGVDTPVFETDFGRVGLATCFDANFPELWQRLADQDAELVIWTSAYAAGASLQAHAINHHYYIVAATKTGNALAFDITGRRILDEHGDDLHVARVTLDLDRGIYHQDFNLAKKEDLLAGHADDVVMEQWLPQEAWFVLRAKRAGVSARALAAEHDLEELRHYIRRSRQAIDEKRRHLFAKPNTRRPK